jgi:hypothetical protein
MAGVKLTSDMDDPSGIPYFLWDRPETIGQLRKRLRGAGAEERAHILGVVLREARDTDVWSFTRPDEIASMWEAIVPHLGRRREFWQWLLNRWREDGLIQD